MNRWKEIAFPALQAIRKLQEKNDHGIVESGTYIAEELKKPMSEVGPQLRALSDDAYIIVGQVAPSGGDPFGLYAIRLAPRGLRVLGDWPSEEIEELIDALSSALEATRDSDDRRKLKALMTKIAKVVTTQGVSEAVGHFIKIVN